MERRAIVNLVIAILFLGTFLSIHELTHGEIYRKYGATNITYGVSPDGLYTQANIADVYDPAGLLLAQSENEIIGYNVVFWLVIIALLVFMNGNKE
jgi:hypothetical protein